MALDFNLLPTAVETLLERVNFLVNEVKEMKESIPANESPIDGKELRKRLDISSPTEVRMRRKGKLPYFLVNGTYRYNWQEVLAALNNPKK